MTPVSKSHGSVSNADAFIAHSLASTTVAFCPQLTTLNLDANPVCKIGYYRQIIANFLPQLTTLDDKPITKAEQAKISDEDIDAAIDAHRQELLAERAAPVAVDDKLLIADGIKLSASAALGSHADERSPRKLSRISSGQRLAGFDPIAVRSLSTILGLLRPWSTH